MDNDFHQRFIEFFLKLPKRYYLTIGVISAEVSWDLVQKYRHLPWSSYEISKNHNITWDIVINNYNFPWNWHLLSKHQNIPIDIILNNFNYPWTWCVVVERDDVSWNMALNNPRLTRYCYKNPNVPIDYLLANGYYDALHYHKDVDIEFILTNATIPWNWNVISAFNPNITKKVLTTYTKCPWDFFELSNRTWLDWSVVSLFLHKGWNWDVISGREFITKDIVMDFVTIPWTMRGLSANPNFSYKDFDITYSHSYLNPNISFDYIIENLDNIGSNIQPLLYYNKFTLERERTYRRILSASKIARWYKMVTVYDTTYKKAREYATNIILSVYSI